MVVLRESQHENWPEKLGLSTEPESVCASLHLLARLMCKAGCGPGFIFNNQEPIFLLQRAAVSCDEREKVVHPSFFSPPWNPNFWELEDDDIAYSPLRLNIQEEKKNMWGWKKVFLKMGKEYYWFLCSGLLHVLRFISLPSNGVGNIFGMSVSQSWLSGLCSLRTVETMSS